MPDASCWVVVANMSEDPRGGPDPDRVYLGTKLFSPGTKLHLGVFYGGMGERIHAIGRARGTARMVNCVIPVVLLQDIRPKLIYSISRLNRLTKLECTFFPDREAAERSVASIQGWGDWLRDEDARKKASASASGTG